MKCDIKPRFYWNPGESENGAISGTLQNAEINLSEKSTITIQPIKSPGDEENRARERCRTYDQLYNTRKLQKASGKEECERKGVDRLVVGK